MVLFGLIMWIMGLYILYLVIQGAINNSKLAKDTEEIKDILKVFKEQIDIDKRLGKEMSLEELEDKVFNRCFKCHKLIKQEDEVCSSCGFKLK